MESTRNVTSCSCACVLTLVPANLRYHFIAFCSQEQEESEEDIKKESQTRKLENWIQDQIEGSKNLASFEGGNKLSLYVCNHHKKKKKNLLFWRVYSVKYQLVAFYEVILPWSKNDLVGIPSKTVALLFWEFDGA